MLQYLGRYTHRVAISKGRLLRRDERTVTCRDEDYRHGGALRVLTLVGTEFVRRLSLHILPPGFTKIRHYGILGNNRRAKDVAATRTALAGGARTGEVTPGNAARTGDLPPLPE